MFSNERVVLYVEASWSSPWVCVVHVVLCEKGIPFTTVTGMMGNGIGVVEVLHGRTYTGTAPVLQHDGFWLAESLAIVEYLEERFPEPRMLPANLQDRARARQLISWMRQEHEVLRKERPAERIVYPYSVEPPPLSAAARRAADDLVRVAQRLGADERGAVFGTFGVIDVDMAFALMRLITTGHEVPAPLRAYAQSVWQRSSMREFIEHQRPPNAPKM